MNKEEVEVDEVDSKMLENRSINQPLGIKNKLITSNELNPSLSNVFANIIEQNETIPKDPSIKEENVVVESSDIKVDTEVENIPLNERIRKRTTLISRLQENFTALNPIKHKSFTNNLQKKKVSHYFNILNFLEHYN